MPGRGGTAMPGRGGTTMPGRGDSKSSSKSEPALSKRLTPNLVEHSLASLSSSSSLNDKSVPAHTGKLTNQHVGTVGPTSSANPVPKGKPGRPPKNSLAKAKATILQKSNISRKNLANLGKRPLKKIRGFQQAKKQTKVGRPKNNVKKSLLKKSSNNKGSTIKHIANNVKGRKFNSNSLSNQKVKGSNSKTESIGSFKSGKSSSVSLTGGGSKVTKSGSDLTNSTTVRVKRKYTKRSDWWLSAPKAVTGSKNAQGQPKLSQSASNHKLDGSDDDDGVRYLLGENYVDPELKSNANQFKSNVNQLKSNVNQLKSNVNRNVIRSKVSGAQSTGSLTKEVTRSQLGQRVQVNIDDITLKAADDDHKTTHRQSNPGKMTRLRHTRTTAGATGDRADSEVSSNAEAKGNLKSQGQPNTPQTPSSLRTAGSPGPRSTYSQLMQLGAPVGKEGADRRPSRRSIERSSRFTQITVSRKDHYNHVRLSTTSVMPNAFNIETFDELCSVFDQAASDDTCKAILITSAKSNFCTGLDLHYLLQVGNTYYAANQMAEKLHQFVVALLTFPKLLVVGVTGAAVGLGAAILPLCDIVLASDKAWFRLPYAALEQPPEACCSATFPEQLGQPLSSDMLLGRRCLTAQQASQHGLVSESLWPDRFEAHVVKRVEAMVQCSTHTLRQHKALLRAAALPRLLATARLECDLLAKAWPSQRTQAAILRFTRDMPEDYGC